MLQRSSVVDVCLFTRRRLARSWIMFPHSFFADGSQVMLVSQSKENTVPKPINEFCGTRKNLVCTYSVGQDGIVFVADLFLADENRNSLCPFL